jgi:hypothetical protein
MVAKILENGNLSIYKKNKMIKALNKIYDKYGGYFKKIKTMQRD